MASNQYGADQRHTAAGLERLTWEQAGAAWPVPTASDDKYSRGVLGVIAGGERYPGAAVLTVTAAVEAGAGMVRYLGTPTPVHLVQHAVPECTYGLGQVQAWVIGPGWEIDAPGQHAAAQREAARSALVSAVPVLIDAGGLDLIDPEVIADRSSYPTLLTPHAGELARLMSRLSGHELTRDQVLAEPLGHARELAERTKAVVLLKGSITYVVSPDASQPPRAQADAPAWLATAGAGDVLAGLIGTLLAAGLSPAEAGAVGALVHGLAADRASAGGPVRALDVAHGIPAAVALMLSRPWDAAL